jgi:hypothetical protein
MTELRRTPLPVPPGHGRRSGTVTAECSSQKRPWCAGRGSGRRRRPNGPGERLGGVAQVVPGGPSRPFSRGVLHLDGRVDLRRLGLDGQGELLAGQAGDGIPGPCSQPPPQHDDQADHDQDQDAGEQAGPGRASDGVAVVVGPLENQAASRWQTGQRRRAAFRSTRSWRRPSARVNPQVVQLAIHQPSSRCRAGGLGGLGSWPGRCRSGLTVGDFGCIGAHSLVPAPGALPARGGSM